MEPTWFYVAIALGAMAGALIFRKLVVDRGIRHRIAAWLMILLGVSVLVIGALETGYDLFFFAAGVMFVLAGVVDYFAWPRRDNRVGGASRRTA